MLFRDLSLTLLIYGPIYIQSGLHSFCTDAHLGIVRLRSSWNKTHTEYCEFIYVFISSNHAFLRSTDKLVMNRIVVGNLESVTKDLTIKTCIEYFLW